MRADAPVRQPAVRNRAKARQLRRDAPESERRLLRALREAFPHLKWRHQVPMGSYYADILCFSERLVVEVDGEMYAEAQDYDAKRTQAIERSGFRVIRFDNADVMQNLDGVLTHISLSLQEREGARAQRGKGEDRMQDKDSAG